MTTYAGEALEVEVAKRIWEANGQTIDLLPAADAHSWGGSVQAQLRNFGLAPDLSPRATSHAAVPDVAAVTLVKDEADVIGLNLEWLHHLGVRRFVVLDNASTDGTAQVVSAFASRHRADCEVEMARDETLAHLQGDKVTFACRHAIARWPDLAWLMPFDADEFIQASDGLQALAAVPADIDALTILRAIHFRPTGTADPAGLDWRDLAAMSVRSGLFAVPPKVFIRATDRLGLGNGNHLAHPAPGATLRYDGGLFHGLFIREFQTRSFRQFHSKVRNGGAAIRAAAALGSDAGGQHWLAWDALLQEGGEPALRAEYLKVAFRDCENYYVADRFVGLADAD